MKICLVGNPNCGKTTIFNRLTGAKQKVGNWAGVTVEKKVGSLSLDSHTIDIIDLPGIYSLDQIDPGQDEAIAAAFLLQKDYDLIINIVDAANLSRNLVLTTQLLELNTPIIVLANMVDVAKQKGILINFEALSERLKTKIIPIVGSTGEGIPELLTALNNSQHALKDTEDSLEEAEETCTFGGQDDHLVGRMQQRHHAVKELTHDIIKQHSNSRNWTEKVDSIVLSRFLGIPIFLLMMYLMFSSMKSSYTPFC